MLSRRLLTVMVSFKFFIHVFHIKYHFGVYINGLFYVKSKVNINQKLPALLLAPDENHRCKRQRTHLFITLQVNVSSLLPLKEIQ